MKTFDPEAATAAYLATLSPDAHARATAYTQGGHWLILWTAVVGVAAYWLILRSGLLVRLRDRLLAVQGDVGCVQPDARLLVDLPD